MTAAREALDQMFVWVETWMPGASGSPQLDAARGYLAALESERDALAAEVGELQRYPTVSEIAKLRALREAAVEWCWLEEGDLTNPNWSEARLSWASMKLRAAVRALESADEVARERELEER